MKGGNMNNEHEEIVFENGSVITPIKNTNNKRGKRADIFLYMQWYGDLKWWQKLYLRVLVFKDQLFSR